MFRMSDAHLKDKDCGGPDDLCCSSGTSPHLQTIAEAPTQEIPCCGPSPGPRSSLFERPGYRLCSFVEIFIDTPAGPVPRVKTALENSDYRITISARAGIQRQRYKVSPGLYCVGSPDEDSPVLVTANYWLSFNALRKELSGIHAWILVLDTRGVNVWCAAGKGTFDTQEVVRQVNQTGLSHVVRRRELILPQLSAVGVSAKDVKKECGFKVTWGPIRTNDIKKFISSGMKADAAMRRVTFSMWERIVLVPVEVSQMLKPTIWILIGVFILSGIGTNVFSFNASWIRGGVAITAYAAGVLAGAIVAPALLPWIPGKAFSVKGAITGFIAGGCVVWMLWGKIERLESLSLILFSMAVSSYLTMNFTGATPYTSPSGVEKEMRRAIPLQAAALFIAAISWVMSAFIK